MIYGYARVSTRGQERDGNSLESQVAALKQAGCAKIFHDSFTGTKMERPEFTKLLALLKSGDRLVVTKLDRFARNTVGGIETIQGLLDRGISVQVLNMGLIDNSSVGRLIMQVMLAFAEFERNQIIERTNAGRAAARENNPNYREGRKKKEVDEDLFSRMYRKNVTGMATVSDCCRELGISRGTWYNRVRSMA